MQDNSLLSTATPREAITFSAKLRLPSTMTDIDIANKVDLVLSDLGITKCADTIIGGEFIKGISGGEMKRTSVAIEIITEPNVSESFIHTLHLHSLTPLTYYKDSFLR